jgi:AcrR family transcriptional regulator
MRTLQMPHAEDATDDAEPKRYLDWLIGMSTNRELAKSARTRFVLLAAAAESLHKKAPAEVSINEIVERAQVQRPTFYTYFNDLHEIFHVLLLTFARMEWHEGWKGVRGGTVLDGIRATNLRYCKMYQMNRRMYHALASFAPRDPELMENHKQLNGRLAKRTVQRLQKSGLLPRVERDTARLEVIVLMLIEMTEGAARQRFAYENEVFARGCPTTEDLAADISDIWQKVLLPKSDLASVLFDGVSKSGVLTVARSHRLRNEHASLRRKGR